MRKRRDTVAGALVFPELARDYDRDSGAVSKRVQATFQAAGLGTTEKRPGVKRAVVMYGAHSLRHYFVTQAIAAGIPGEIVKRITGHSSDAMLEGYEHIDAALIGSLAKKLSAAPSKQSATPAPTLPATDKTPDLRARVRTLAERLNSQTWEAVRKEMLALAGGVG